MKHFLLILFATMFSIQAATAQKMSTITYFQNDTLKLDLNLFLPEKKSNEKLSLVLFAHGGGFGGGQSKDGNIFCEYLAKNGYAAATINYTVYMKNKKFSCDGVLTEKVKAFQFAANDMWLATSYFVENAQKYNIDVSKIFISGSSAGAETALHAAFWDRNLMKIYNLKLPENFKYAGIISGAGAIMDLNLITPSNVIPAFFFHGSGDVTVPYGAASHHFCKTNASGWLMLFGSYSIYNKLIDMDQSASLYTFCGGGHEYAGTLFEKEPQYILAFLNDVLAGKKFQNHAIVATGKKNEISAAYKFCD